jgi:hypothetical protein
MLHTPSRGRLLVVRHRTVCSLVEFSLARPCAQCANMLHASARRHRQLTVSWTTGAANDGTALSGRVALREVPKGTCCAGFLKRKASFPVRGQSRLSTNNARDKKKDGSRKKKR